MPVEDGAGRALNAGEEVTASLVAVAFDVTSFDTFDGIVDDLVDEDLEVVVLFLPKDILGCRSDLGLIFSLRRDPNNGEKGVVVGRFSTFGTPNPPNPILVLFLKGFLKNVSDRRSGT
jgi:hypothetical protein